MTDTAIVQVPNAPLTIQEAMQRYNLIVEFTKMVMKSGKDYGVIPGTGTKPTLLKPGAEKLCSLFRLADRFVPLQQIIDFEKGLFYIQYECQLYDTAGNLVASGIGSCNSMEKKYRYRNVPEWKASIEDKAVAIRTETRTNKRGQYKTYIIENPEPFDLVNTIDKMAQKRALVAATLIAANASEFFTQDIEDLDIIEGDFEEVPQQAPPEATGTPKSNGKKQGRPLDAEGVRKALQHKSATYSLDSRKASDKQRKLLVGQLSTLSKGDDGKRYTFTRYTLEKASSKDLLDGDVLALLDWLALEEDDDGQNIPSQYAIQEFEAVLSAAYVDEGQKELI
jgi:hypothetical protein